jgi:hypothetical protein
MLTAEGCKQRRQRFWASLDPKPDGDYLLLADPIHLMYLANFYVDPFSLGGGFRGYLVLRNDGFTKLIHENRLTGRVNSLPSRLSTLADRGCASTTASAIPMPKPSFAPWPTTAAARIPTR